MLSVDDMNSRVMKINFDNEPGLNKEEQLIANDKQAITDEQNKIQNDNNQLNALSN